jgi:hypothetical protein
MILIISSGGAHVEDADDLHGLSVRRLDGASVDASLAKPTEAGTHCWIVIDRLRELAATGQPADHVRESQGVGRRGVRMRSCPPHAGRAGVSAAATLYRSVTAP